VRHEKGFTLLELLIVVIIIGILATIALPQYINMLEKARASEAVSNIGSLRSSMDRYWYEHLDDTATLGNLDIIDPNDQEGRLYTYSLANTSTASEKIYTIRAERTTNSAYWVEWIQSSTTSGRLSKAAGL